MTAKRFDWDLNGIWDFQSDSDEYLESSKEICELLNKLHEENQLLKERRHEDINELSVIAMRFKALEKENEKLRRCINSIYTIARLEEVD